MKRIVIILLFMGMFCISIFSQSEQVKTVSNHTLRFGVLRLGYNYEHPIGKRTSLNSEVLFGAQLGGNSSLVYWRIQPRLRLEPRFYYSLDKRVLKEKKTLRNMGAYLSCSTDWIIPVGIKEKTSFEKGFILNSKWGMRYVLGKHFLAEFDLGPVIGISKENEWGIGFIVDIRFGIIF